MYNPTRLESTISAVGLLSYLASFGTAATAELSGSLKTLKIANVAIAELEQRALADKTLETNDFVRFDVSELDGGTYYVRLLPRNIRQDEFKSGSIDDFFRQVEERSMKIKGFPEVHLEIDINKMRVISFNYCRHDTECAELQFNMESRNKSFREALQAAQKE